MIRKNLPPNGRMPNLRTFDTGRWGDSLDLEWLPPKLPEGRGEESETVPDTEPWEPLTDTRVDSVDRDTIYVNNNTTNNNIAACSNNSSFISRDNHSSSSRSSFNNLAEDDATKRRGVG